MALSSKKTASNSPETGLSTVEPLQRTQKFFAVQVVLERFPPVDENHGDLVVVFLPQFGVEIDVYLAPLKFSAGLDSRKGLLHHFAEMTALS